MTEQAAPGVIARAATILRILGRSATEGMSTSDLARASAMARPTAHRLLVSLAGEGLVDRDQTSGRWWLGAEMYLLGTAAAPRYDITRHAQESVSRLAAATGESAFLSVRRGDETVCLLREDGSFPIRSFVLYEGARFPLGVVSAGLAILSFLPGREIDAFLASNDLTPRFGPSHSTRAIRRRIAKTRRDGYALNPGLVVEGSWGLAAAVFDASGQPAWALTLTGIESRFRPERQEHLGKLLLEEAQKLKLRL